MCGIVYMQDFTGRPVNNGILDAYDAQRNRGVQGFGLFDGREGNIIRAKDEDKILNWLCKYDSDLILFHHRYPTSTKNTKRTAHPFATKDYFGKTQYILVHNGHISNSSTLKAEHEKLGIKYQSYTDENGFNDSEALLWDVALTLEGKQKKLKSTGAIAFICLRLKEGILEKMFFGRNSNPLNLYREKDGIMLSSQGLGEPIDSDKLYTWNYALKRLTTKKFEIPRWVEYTYPAQTYQRQSYGYTATRPPATYIEDGYEYDYYEDDERAEWLETINWDEIESSSEMDVKTLVLRFLINNNGVFEAACDEMEQEYYNLQEYAYTTEELTAMRMYERGLHMLETDREWVNETSVSSMFTERQIRLLERSEDDSTLRSQVTA